MCMFVYLDNIYVLVIFRRVYTKQLRRQRRWQHNNNNDNSNNNYNNHDDDGDVNDASL